jgi:hypothetical protein
MVETYPIIPSPWADLIWPDRPFKENLNPASSKTLFVKKTTDKHWNLKEMIQINSLRLE